LSRISALSIRSPVEDEEKMSPGNWLGSVLRVPSVLWHCWFSDWKDICTIYPQTVSFGTSGGID